MKMDAEALERAGTAVKAPNDPPEFATWIAALSPLPAGRNIEGHRQNPPWRFVMVRNEAEYQEAVKRLAAEQSRLADHRARLKEAGLSEEEIKRVIDPMESFRLQFAEDVESYERLKRR